MLLCYPVQSNNFGTDGDFTFMGCDGSCHLKGMDYNKIEALLRESSVLIRDRLASTTLSGKGIISDLSGHMSNF